jgi:hypothetical protein
MMSSIRRSCRGATATPGKQFDISAIDFDRLRAEFEHRPTKHSDTLSLMDAVEKRLDAHKFPIALRGNCCGL